MVDLGRPITDAAQAVQDSAAPHHSDGTHPGLAQRILDYATQFLGVPYVWGGTSPQGFDCSGLIQYTYNHFGLNLPRIADAQARAGKPVKAADARPGDLVYFENNSSEPGYDHIGIYLGHGMMLAAPHTGAQVRIQPVGAAAGFDRVLPQQAFKSLEGSGGEFHYRLPNGQSVGEAAMSVTSGAANGENTTTPPNAVPGAFDEVKPMSVHDYLSTDVSSEYGYLSAFLHNKEIGPIIAKAAKNGWSQDHMLAALEKTDWWKHTSASARAWQALKQTDPATAHQQLRQAKQQIRQLAKSTLGGGILTDERINQLANASIAAGWSQAELQHAIGAEFKYHGAQQAYRGAAGQTVTQLQAIAKQYVVPLSNHTLDHWARQILEGTFTTQDFQAYAQQQAESMYPTLKNALKSGQTVMQYADPYLQIASQILEKPVDQFDLSKPKWNKALLQPLPDGDRKAMDLADWANYLRALPEYKTTSQAKAATADFGLAIGNIFGKVNTPYGGNLADTAMNFGSTG